MRTTANRQPPTANRSINRRNAVSGERRAEFVQVITTSDRLVVARRIAQTCVEQRLAACAQILGPIESTYHWKGRVVKAREWFCFLKTRRSLFPRLEREINSRHNYEVPEIVALPIQTMSTSYREWLDRELARV